MKTNNTGNQWRWVLLLLGAAVILPTVCLLWFMNQAVQNGQLAAKIRIKQVYTQHCNLSAEKNLSAEQIRRDLLSAKLVSDGILVYDENEALVFPIFDDEVLSPDAVFDKAIQLEFREQDYEKALAEYQQINLSTSGILSGLRSQVAQARCLHKLGRIDQAMMLLFNVIYDFGDPPDMAVRIQQCHARLLYLRWLKDINPEGFKKELLYIYDYAIRNIPPYDPLVPVDPWVLAGDPGFCLVAVPSSLRIFVLEQFIEYARQLEPDPTLDKKIRNARWLVSALTLSLAATEEYSALTHVDLETFTQNGLFCLQPEKQVYAISTQQLGNLRVLLFRKESLSRLFQTYLDEVEALPSQCCIYDKQGRFVAGSPVRDGAKPFLVLPLGGENSAFPGWTARIYVRDDIFDDIVKKQAAVYVWSAMLIIVFLVFSAAVTTRTIGRQIRLNRLKNDFIATVTHELKTPLASTRLLVDTLLENDCSDEKQIREYLELIAKENHRLSRLIDNFLTFSRMERNKQAFEFAAADPAAIARAAADAVQTKFPPENGSLALDIPAGLPPVTADKDAMITVLVNLLDNAWKYSGPVKHVALKVFTEDNQVCFAVTDNGIGLTRRQAKRIFERFYQVDSSLTRKTEGAGLGLSIVQFIVDAHHGRVEVDSKPAVGSIFTVRLPLQPKGAQ